MLINRQFMNETEIATDWRNLREFTGVDLEKSFILSWAYESGTLLADVDLYLTPEHPSYEKPRPAEKVCIRSAVVEFPYCEKVLVDNNVSRDRDVGPRDAVAELGPGAIQGLRRVSDDKYEISGEFPSVLIHAERPILRIKKS